MHCGGSGYWGRVAIFEFFNLDNTIRDMIMARANIDEIRKKAESLGMETLFKNGLRKAVAGITTIEEIIAVATDLS